MTDDAAPLTLIGSPGCGSAIVEMALALLGLPHVLEDLPYRETGPGRDRLLALNPTGKVPVLVIPGAAPDGGDLVMTESAAILLHLADLAGARGAELVPAAGDPLRPVFLRWLVFLVAEIYPAITVPEHADDTGLAGEPLAGFRAGMQARRDGLWRMLEAAADPAGPWFLGRRFSAIDLYLAVMSAWAGGRARFARVTPHLGAIAGRARALPRVAAVLARHGDIQDPLQDGETA